MKVSREEFKTIINALYTCAALCDATMSFSKDVATITEAAHKKENLGKLIEKIKREIEL